MTLLLAQVIGSWTIWAGSPNHWAFQRLRGAVGLEGVEKWSFAVDEGVEGQFAAVGDLDGDGSPEVVFGGLDGYVRCLSGETGQVIWEFRTGGPVRSAPALADLNGDGKLEVVAGSDDETVYCLSAGGGFIWYLRTLGPVRASPLPLDADGDGLPEIIVGADDSTVYCVDGEGSLLWTRKAWGAIRGSPGAGDLDGDGSPEVVFGAGQFAVCFPTVDTGPRWSFKARGGVYSPVIADLDFDGRAEVIFGSEDSTVRCLDRRGNLLWSFGTQGPAEGVAVGWVDGELRVFAVDGSGRVYSLGRNGSEVWERELGFLPSEEISLADLDRDGEPEILVAGGYKLVALRASDGSTLWEVSLGLGASAPYAADLDGDGCSEVVAGSGEGLSTFDDPSGSEDCGLVGVREGSALPSPIAIRQTGRWVEVGSSVPTEIKLLSYAPDGRLEGVVYEGQLSGSVRLPVPRGVHILSTGRVSTAVVGH